MPELPEVETIVQDIAPRLTGHTLQNPRLTKTDVLRGITRPRLLAALSGVRIVRVTRRAKHAVFELNSGDRMVIQPRMTGSLIVYDRPLTPVESRYAVLTAQVSGGGTFVYRDVRRLGTISLLDPDDWQAYTGRIGPEPLDPAFTAEAFLGQMQRTSQAIKKAVMDQRLLAGVGNIYANEALFMARIDPSRPANRLTEPESRALFQAIRRVLQAALRARGTTLRDYRTGTGQRGGFQFRLRVYGREGERCVRCRTPLAGTHAIDGRATTFCWRCQGGSGSG